MVIEKILKFAWKEFNYGGHFVSLGVVSIISASAILLNIKISWSFLLFIYLVNNTIYLFNYFKEVDEDGASKSERLRYIKKNIKNIPLIIVCYSVFIFSFMAYTQEWAAVGFGVFLFLAGLLYSVFLKKLTRYVLGFKNIFVALLWGLSLVFLAFFYHYPINASLILLFIFIFLLIFFHEIIFDIRDVAEDEKADLLTFPIFLNRTALNAILFFLTFFAAFSVIYGVLNNLLPLSAISLLFIIPYNYLIFKQTKNKIDYATNMIYIENILFFPFIFIVSKLI